MSMVVLGAAAVACLLPIGMVAAPALAHERPDEKSAARCSVKRITGKWVFVTVQHGFHSAALGPYAAIGTLNVDAQGRISGTIDANLPFGIVRRDPYTGTLTVDGDCTGQMAFTTGGGGSGTFSIVVSGGGQELSGMSLDEGDVSTFTAKRTGTKF